MPSNMKNKQTNTQTKQRKLQSFRDILDLHSTGTGYWSTKKKKTDESECG